MKELMIYIHIPFCKSRCSYCDFNTYANRDELIDKYFDALLKEIERYSKRIKNEYSIKSIYIGGGTPSYVDSEYIERLMLSLKQFKLTKNCEITIECNPESLSEDKIERYKDCGINRFSLGIQCLDNDVLKTMSRIHNADQAVNAINNLKKHGINNISADLIIGFPGQSIEAVEKSINMLIALEIQHLSVYSLKVEENTLLRRMIDEKKVEVLDDSIDRDMYHMSTQILESHGYMQYEISNFAIVGKESKHNMGYWLHTPYIGFGAGAFSYFDNNRFSNITDPQEYIDKVSNGEKIIENIEIINKEELIKEYMILRLRLIKGLNTDDFENKFNMNIYDIYGKEIEGLINRGLIKEKDKEISLTTLGLDLANQVFVEFI